MAARTVPAARSLLLPALLSALLGAALFAGTAANGFVFDDVNIVQKNPLASDPWALRSIFSSHYWANVHAGGNLYRPLTIWSFALNHAITGAGPAGFHLTNALLHGAVCFLVVLLAGALGWTRAGATAAGLLFAAHPIHTEAVAPVTGRSELLAALFALAAWLCHLRATRRVTGRGGVTRRIAILIATAAVLLAAGGLSKENALVLPALVVCGDLIARRDRKTLRVRLASIAAMVVAAGSVLVLRARVIPGLAPDDPLGAVFGGVGAAARVMTSMGVLLRYAGLLAFPVKLSADYSYHQIPLITSPLNGLFIAAVLVYLGVAAAGFFLAAKGRLSGLGLLVYLGALFPVSNLPFSIGTVMAERLLYLPSLGLCLFVPAIYREIFGDGRTRAAVRRTAAALLVVVVGLYGARVLARNADWKDQHTLFTATVKTSPDSAKAHYNLGEADDELGDPDGAMKEYRRAIAIKPDMVQAYRNCGLDLLAAGHADEALPLLEKAAGLDPTIQDIFGDVGIALHQLGRSDEAMAALREEIRRRPGSGRAHYNLGTLLLETGKPAAALAELRQAGQLDPADADVQAQLGAALDRLGRPAEALEAYRNALRLDPSLHELLIPLARSARAAGREGTAREAVRRARDLGQPIPADLQALDR